MTNTSAEEISPSQSWDEGTLALFKAPANPHGAYARLARSGWGRGHRAVFEIPMRRAYLVEDSVDTIVTRMI